MKKFESLNKGNPFDVERKISMFWDNVDILNKSIELRNKKENFVFYDGPAYANGFPGVHHMLAKILKDAVCKYKTMKGFRVERKVG
jgi:isoleucyl-tRNA synthetase